MSSTTSTLDADAVLAALDPEQREVATTLAGPLCVLAGAGTGKTRAITHRIAYGVHSGVYVPQQVLAVTFTARAAGEMRSRLRDLGVAGVQARTFHAAALRQLQYFWPQAVGGSPPPLADHKAPLVGAAASRLRLRLDRAAIRDLSAEIEWAKVAMVTAEEYPEAARRARREGAAGLDPLTVARVLRGYEEVKDERGVIDFEDVLLLTAGILEDRADIAATVRGQYRHFIVDEYQDVSGLQQRVLDLWLGGRDAVCVVGDPSQTIYTFAGADPHHLLGFARRYPGAAVVRLVRDYRSTPQVVSLANRVLDAAPAPARTGRVELVAQRPPGPEPELTAYDDDVAEAEGVARRLRELIASGVPAREIAVLFRTNAQSVALEQALGDAEVGYVVRGGERFFHRAEVRQAITLLRGAARADDGEQPLGESVRSVLGSAGWVAEPPAASGAVRERWDSLQALVALADELAAGDPSMRMRALVAEIDERASNQHAPAVDGVTLASMHAAKGLEWDVVAMVGLSEGLVPISFAADSPDAVEEERRLFYVGVTRARERVLLSWARARHPGGRAGRKPSRFLDPVLGTQGAEAVHDRPARRPKRRRNGAVHTTCRGCGKPLGAAVERKTGRCAQCPPDHDEALFDELRQWRSTVAQEAKVPAYVVLTDATLEALSFAKPSDDQGLLAISGIGPRKLEQYGEQVLAVIATHRD